MVKDRRLIMRCRSYRACAEERSYHYVSFDNLLATSDVIVLMTPLTPQTTHLIGSAEFEKMQDGVIIVNTSRGAVIDEAELVKALDSGKGEHPCLPQCSVDC